MLTFSNPLLLWAFPVLLLPWIFRRRQEERIQHVEFPLLQFLLESQEKDLIHPRLQELLLLILRTLLLAILLLALAGPKWMPQGGYANRLFSLLPFGRALQSTVVVLDTSYSMGYALEQNSWWTRTRRAMEQLESDLSGLAVTRVRWDDTLMDGGAAGGLPLLSADDVHVLFETPPSHPGMSASELLARLQSFFTRQERILILTDGQRLPWQAFLESDTPVSLPPTLVITVGEEPVMNAWFEANSFSTPPWGIANWETIAGEVFTLGPLNAANATLSILNADSRESLFSQSIPLAPSPDSIASIPFQFTAEYAGLVRSSSPIQNQSAGPLRFQIVLDANDPLPIDNRLDVAVPRITSFHVGLAYDADNPPDAVPFLQAAFQPDSGAPGRTTVQVTPLSPPDLPITPDLNLVILAMPWVPWWSPADTSKILEYAKQGGALLLFTGGEPSPNSAWNDLLASLGWSWLNADASGPAPGLVEAEKSRLLAQVLSTWAPTMWKPWIAPRPGHLQDPHALPLLTYRQADQSAHLLAELALGRGRAWIVNTSLRTDSDALWSPILPAMIWEIAKETARANQYENIPLPPRRAESDLRLLTESDKSKLEQQYGIQFATAEDMHQQLSHIFGGLDLRWILLFLCALAALTESWLSNRLASA